MHGGACGRRRSHWGLADDLPLCDGLHNGRLFKGLRGLGLHHRLHGHSLHRLRGSSLHGHSLHRPRGSSLHGHGLHHRLRGENDGLHGRSVNDGLHGRSIDDGLLRWYCLRNHHARRLLLNGGQHSENEDGMTNLSVPNGPRALK